MSDPQTEQRLDDIDQRIDRLSEAVDVLVTQFLRPSAQQAMENQQAIARLIERSEQHQEWLDEDRHDLADHRLRQSEQSRQIQALIEENRQDRAEANQRFSEANQRFNDMQAEIRQNQRLLLAGQRRAEENGQRLDALLAEVLSLSRRVTAVEDAA